MGTINYKRNKYVTVGVNADIFTTEIDEEFDEFESDLIIIDYYEEITNIIAKYTFEYINVEIKSGYYEGFYIDFDIDYCFLIITRKKCKY